MAGPGLAPGTQWDEPLPSKEVSGFDLGSGATGPPALAQQMLVAWRQPWRSVGEKSWEDMIN